MTTATIPQYDVIPANFSLAGFYKKILDKYLETKGGKSCAFGENGSTSFWPEQAYDDIKLAFIAAKTTEKNLAAIKLLDEWFAKPDDLGLAFWREFDKELESNGFSIP